MVNEIPTRHGFAEIDGGQLYYEVAGSGKPVVLVHAGIADHRMWDDQLVPFAERYQVIRFDQRGFGQSSAPIGPFAFYDDLYLLLRELSVTRAVCIGGSLGGATAIDLTLTHPEMVDALVLVGSGLGGMEWPPLTPVELELFSQVEEAAKSGDFATANEIEVHIWVDGPERNPDAVNPGVRARVREMNLQTFTLHGENEQVEPQALGASRQRAPGRDSRANPDLGRRSGRQCHSGDCRHSRRRYPRCASDRPVQYRPCAQHGATRCIQSACVGLPRHTRFDRPLIGREVATFLPGGGEGPFAKLVTSSSNGGTICGLINRGKWCAKRFTQGFCLYRHPHRLGWGLPCGAVARARPSNPTAISSLWPSSPAMVRLSS